MIKRCPECAQLIMPKEIHTGLLPEKWEVGHVVITKRDSVWAWSAGQRMVIREVRDEYADRTSDQYQGFYTSPLEDNMEWYGRSSYWTTPDDVVWTGICLDLDKLRRR